MNGLTVICLRSCSTKEVPVKKILLSIIIFVLAMILLGAGYVFLYGTQISPQEVTIYDILFDKDNGSGRISGFILSSAKAFRSAHMHTQDHELHITIRAVLVNPFYSDGHFQIEFDLASDEIERIFIVTENEMKQIYP